MFVDAQWCEWFRSLFRRGRVVLKAVPIGMERSEFRGCHGPQNKYRETNQAYIEMENGVLSIIMSSTCKYSTKAIIV